MQNQKMILAATLAGGALAGLTWMPFFTGPVIFVAFVPFFLMAASVEQMHQKYGNRLLFIRVLPGFIIFNAIAISWTRIAGIPLMLAAITANSFLMSFAFWLGWLTGIKAGRGFTPVTIAVAWLAMEFATNNFWLFSPWLNLGNALAGNRLIVQWYEFLGVSGGTLWILTVNILIAAALMKIWCKKERKSWITPAAGAVVILIAPVLVSGRLLDRVNQLPDTSVTITLLQPNTDPYTEKFSTPFIEQLDSLLAMAGTPAVNDPEWIITPETAIDDPISLQSADSSIYIRRALSFLQERPNTALLLGATTSSGAATTVLHNSALLVTPQGVESVYHKSRLVPGIERPFGRSVKFLQHLFPYLGGTGAGFHPQTGSPVMKHHISGTGLAPVICFESAFPDHVASFVREGAGIIAVITNDGWWKGTYGYHQHLSFSSLRAIETRRPVVRAANTGVSAIIDPAGKIISYLPWWTKGTLTGNIAITASETFFVKYGDLTGRVSATIMIFLLLVRFIAIPLRKWTAGKNF